MTVEEYLIQNKESIGQECDNVAQNGAKAIITVKESGDTYIRKISTVGEFVPTIPDDKFFKKMKDGINNAVLNKIVPIVVFEGQTARIISLPDDFKLEM